MRLTIRAIAALALVSLGTVFLLRSTSVPSNGPAATASVSPSPQIQAKPIEQKAAPEPSSPVDSRPVIASRSLRTKARIPVDGSYVDVSLGEFRAANDMPEETTEFIPTIQGSDFAPLSSGQVVRVMVPRSAMNYFGLPVNADRVNEKVAADVLLGEDGLARAIRFVR